MGASASKSLVKASLLWRDGIGSSEWCAGRGGVKK